MIAKKRRESHLTRPNRETSDLQCALKFNSNFVDDSLAFWLFLQSCKLDAIGFCCAACIPLRGREHTSPSENALNGVLEGNINSTYFGISTHWHLCRPHENLWRSGLPMSFFFNAGLERRARAGSGRGSRRKGPSNIDER
mgnify:CR=1 FL=1